MELKDQIQMTSESLKFKFKFYITSLWVKLCEFFVSLKHFPIMKKIKIKKRVRHRTKVTLP